MNFKKIKISNKIVVGDFNTVYRHLIDQTTRRRFNKYILDLEEEIKKKMKDI